MRVVCENIEEFLDDLTRTPPERVLQRGVRAAIIARPSSGGYKFAVTLRMTAVIGLENGGQYLLDAAIPCGNDVHTADGNSDGTETARLLRGRLEEFCVGRGLYILPGSIEI